MPDRAIRFVLSVVCDEEMQAEQGEAAVVVNDTAIWSQRFSRSDLEGHVAGAIVALAQEARDALDVQSATKEELPPEPSEAPPSPAKGRAPKRRQNQTIKGNRVSGVSLSRRL